MVDCGFFFRGLHLVVRHRLAPGVGLPGKVTGDAAGRLAVVPVEPLGERLALAVVAGLGERLVLELLHGLKGGRRGVDRRFALLAVVGVVAQVQDLPLAREILVVQLLLAHRVGFGVFRWRQIGGRRLGALAPFGEIELGHVRYSTLRTAGYARGSGDLVGI